MNITIIALNFFETVKFSENGTAVAMPTNHNQAMHPSHYLIEIDGKKLYYALDGAWILFETFYYLKDKEVDMVVFDGTVGDYEGDFRVAEHNSIPMIRLMLKSFVKFNIYKENARIFISHIAPSLHKSHQETVEKMAKDNIEVAYDGLSIDI